MPTELESILPILLPRAIEWVKTHSESILAAGSALDDRGLRLAKAVGVSHPERIRISIVESLPLPDDPELRGVALETGILGPGMIGVTFGYGIYLRAGHVSARLVSHECRHVYQYEAAGSIDAFLPVYLQQIATVGYFNAPLEVDARQHELDEAIVNKLFDRQENPVRSTDYGIDNVGR